MERTLTQNKISNFYKWLQSEEKSENTIEKYIRDVTAFMAYLGGSSITKEMVITYKSKLIDENYAVRSINSMLASLNSLFAFLGWVDLKVKSIKLQTDLIYAQTEAQKVVIDSQAQATKRAQEGYTYAQERGFDVAEKVAQNEAVGEFTNMGVGFGTMAGVGGAVGGMVGGIMNDTMNSVMNPAPTQTQPADDMVAFKAKIDKLTMMKEAGMISDDEFNTMKAKLLSEFM